MKQYYISKLRSTLQSSFKWNKSRIGFLTSFVTLMILLATVKLNRISLLMQGKAKSESKYRNIQRFFQLFKMDYEEYSRFAIGLLSSQKRYYLVMDRTNWKFGKTDINILMLGVIFRNNSFPLFWKLLDKRGSSSTGERRALMNKAINLLGKDRIQGLLGDREFIGAHWFRYLISEQIEFHIRIPKQVKAGSYLQKHRRTVQYLFRHCKQNVKVDYPKPVKILGFNLYVSAMKSSKGPCLVVSSKSNLNSLEKYQMRWTIENMFGAFKERGFNFEDTVLVRRKMEFSNFDLGRS